MARNKIPAIKENEVTPLHLFNNVSVTDISLSATIVGTRRWSITGERFDAH